MACAHVIPPQLVIPAQAGIQYAGKAVIIRYAAAYWVARSSRAMTAEFVVPDCPVALASAGFGARNPVMTPVPLT
jgi:hypothetical protein